MIHGKIAEKHTHTQRVRWRGNRMHIAPRLERKDVEQGNVYASLCLWELTYWMGAVEGHDCQRLSYT
jgi:hypothetical protein